MEFLQYLSESFFTLEDMFSELHWHNLILLVEALIFLWLGKLFKDWVSPYKLNDLLTKEDNKAVALSFGGYLIGIGWIIYKVMESPSLYGAPFWRDYVDLAIWCVVGILLINLSGWINNKIMLRKFDNVKEMVKDKNTGVAAVELGSFTATGFVVGAVVSGQGDPVWGYAYDVVALVVFYILAQAALIVFSLIYRAITPFDDDTELERDNAAAGVSFGLSLSALGIVIAHPIQNFANIKDAVLEFVRSPEGRQQEILSGIMEDSDIENETAAYLQYLTNYNDSVLAFLFWVVLGAAVLLAIRFFTDKVILPYAKLDQEISKDQNWGAALLEGALAIIGAILLTTVL